LRPAFWPNRAPTDRGARRTSRVWWRWSIDPGVHLRVDGTAPLRPFLARHDAWMHAAVSGCLPGGPFV